MKTSLVLASVSAAATLAVVVSFLCVGRPSSDRPNAPSTNVEGTRLLGRLPIAFVPHVGQWEHDAGYVARFGAMTVFLEEKGWSFTLVERSTARWKESRNPVNENASARRVAV